LNHTLSHKFNKLTQLYNLTVAFGGVPAIFQWSLYITQSHHAHTSLHSFSSLVQNISNTVGNTSGADCIEWSIHITSFFKDLNTLLVTTAFAQYINHSTVPLVQYHATVGFVTVCRFSAVCTLKNNFNGNVAADGFKNDCCALTILYHVVDR
jgi:hypothetical protein